MTVLDETLTGGETSHRSDHQVLHDLNNYTGDDYPDVTGAKEALDFLGLVRHRTMLDYGGSTSLTDNGPAFVEAAASGLEVKVKSGIWSVRSAVALPQTGTVHLKGDGQGSTIINFNRASAASLTNYAFTRDATSGDVEAATILEGMTVHGTDIARATQRTIHSLLELTSPVAGRYIGPIIMRDIESYNFFSVGLVDTDAEAIATRVTLDNCYSHDQATTTMWDAGAIATGSGGAGLFSGQCLALLIDKCVVDGVGPDPSVSYNSGIWGIAYLQGEVGVVMVDHTDINMTRGGIKLGTTVADYQKVHLDHVTMRNLFGQAGVYAAVDAFTNDKWVRDLIVQALTIQLYSGSHGGTVPVGMQLLTGVDGASFTELKVDMAGKSQHAVVLGNGSASTKIQLKNIDFEGVDVRGQTALGAGHVAFNVVANGSADDLIEDVTLSRFRLRGGASTAAAPGYGLRALAANGGVIRKLDARRGKVGPFNVNPVYMDGVTDFDLHEIRWTDGDVKLVTSTEDGRVTGMRGPSLLYAGTDHKIHDNDAHVTKWSGGTATDCEVYNNEPDDVTTAVSVTGNSTTLDTSVGRAFILNNANPTTLAAVSTNGRGQYLDEIILIGGTADQKVAHNAVFKNKSGGIKDIDIDVMTVYRQGQAGVYYEQ